MHNTTPPFVLLNATNAQLEQAAADNHKQLFCLAAMAKGGEVRVADGITWTYAGATCDGSIAFPALEAATASIQLDLMMEYYRSNPPQSVGCWSLNPAQPADLGVRLLVRGFQTGWQPCWMTLDLNTLNNPFLQPGGITIKEDNHTDITKIKDLPYQEDGAYMSQPLLKAYPELAHRFVAVVDGNIVGQTCVFLTTGFYGIAGIYNVGVVPTYRNKGIGKALVQAACLFAKEKGYGYAMLNANHMGRPVYEQVGFRFVGYGLTWWLMGQRYISHPPSATQVALAEAAGLGDIKTLDTLYNKGLAFDLNTPLTNKMTLVQLAALCKQLASAEWLIAHGAAYTALDAWDLQWKERAAALLTGDPGEVNRRYYDWQGTLMHVAIERNDTALAQLALTAGVDLTIRDTQHDGDAMGWALHFNRQEIIRLIGGQTGLP